MAKKNNNEVTELKVSLAKENIEAMREWSESLPDGDMKFSMQDKVIEMEEWISSCDKADQLKAIRRAYKVPGIILQGCNKLGLPKTSVDKLPQLQQNSLQIST